MSDIENIKNRIVQVIIRDLELNIGTDELQRADRLDEMFGMDSIAIIDLVVGIEREFDIRIPPDYLTVSSFQNVATIAEHVFLFIHGKEHGR